MRKSNKPIIAIAAILFFQIGTLEYGQAQIDHKYGSLGIKLNKSQHTSTYVTDKTDPEHYDVAGNATRTCGKGHNPMNKQHRRNHRYKRPHFHPFAPWRPGCEE